MRNETQNVEMYKRPSRMDLLALFEQRTASTDKPTGGGYWGQELIDRSVGRGPTGPSASIDEQAHCLGGHCIPTHCGVDI